MASGWRPTTLGAVRSPKRGALDEMVAQATVDCYNYCECVTGFYTMLDEHLDVPLDYEGMASVGSMLGTKALQIFDETTCVVRAVRRWTQFYAHESCGKCTPCREGT